MEKVSYQFNEPVQVCTRSGSWVRRYFRGRDQHGQVITLWRPFDPKQKRGNRAFQMHGDEDVRPVPSLDPDGSRRALAQSYRNSITQARRVAQQRERAAPSFETGKLFTKIQHQQTDV